MSLFLLSVLHTAHLCPKPRVEGIFSSIVESMLKEQSMPKGDILDVGANTGEMTCLYACASPTQTIYAIDPSYREIRNLNCEPYKNIKKKVMTLSRSGANTIDQVFKETKMGFLHMDVEGNELDLLIGGNNVISRDRPVFSVEVHYMRQEGTRIDSLSDHIKHLNYTSYVIHEVCGHGMDCRNILCLPDELLHELAYVPILDVAIRSGIMVETEIKNVQAYSSRTPLRHFYDSAREPTLLRRKDAAYVCNHGGRKWKQDSPCIFKGAH